MGTIYLVPLDRVEAHVGEVQLEIIIVEVLTVSVQMVLVRMRFVSRLMLPAPIPF